MLSPVFRQEQHKNQRKNKYVESRLVRRLDSGSSPLTSTQITAVEMSLLRLFYVDDIWHYALAGIVEAVVVVRV